MALVVAVLFKYFVVEAYKIPTGSMQPTLFGWQNEDGGGIYDRILVDKASYHWRDPERFEVCVFRYPLDRSKNFIKRLWGLPGDRLRIRHGDVWCRRSDAEPWAILRRPPSVLSSTWLEVRDDGRWAFGPGTWEEQGGDLVAAEAGLASFPEGEHSVRDNYTDGYPPKLGELIAAQRSLPGNSHSVGDLRLRVRLTPEADCEEVRLQLHEGTRRYTAVLPGPAAPEGSPILLRLSDTTHRLDPQELEGAPPALRAGTEALVVFENLDDVLTLHVGDQELRLAVEPARDQRSRVVLETVGGGARFADTSLWRDIYYTTADATHEEFQIPEGHYFMLGDNTLDSRDSRSWRLKGYKVDGERLRGSGYDGDELNPQVQDGLCFYRDEYGERHVFPVGAEQIVPLDAPFVPRQMIAGRALLVFWPYAPSLDVYRLGWIR